ncbi:MAG: glycoside hydrolase family 3 N-terminal domain-containing protein [Pseudomonadota bacterium]
MLAPAGLDLSRGEIAFFRQADPWGFILFARNIDTPDQVRALTASLREAVGRDAPIFIDQEGGRVQRMRAPHWREWVPPWDEVARTPDPDRDQILALRYRIIGAELIDLGIDGNCVPCADIQTPDTHTFLANRCLGSDAATVARFAMTVAAAAARAGVLPVIKHMPGHGRAVTDSHLEVPRVTAGKALLKRQDFAVFRDLAYEPVGMTSHVIYEAFDDRPATLSPVIIDLIRQDIGFAGLLMTDDISMGALTGSIAQRSTAAIAAGCDLVLHCNGEMAEMEAVVAATGRLTDAGQTRASAALAAQKTRAAPGDIDVAELAATYEQLVKGFNA